MVSTEEEETVKGVSLRAWAMGVVAALLLTLTLGLTASAAGGTWTLGPTSPFFFTRFDGQTVGGTVYFLGGRDQNSNTDGTIWKLDLATKVFSMTGATMTVPISNYQIAKLTVGTKTLLCVFGGRDSAGNIITDVQCYDPATNTVVEDTQDPWPGTTPSNCVSLPAMGVAVVANKAYVFGGNSFASSGCLDDNSTQIWSYDPSAAAGSRWTQLANLSLARGYVTPLAVAPKGKILAIGGDQNIGGSLFAQTTVDIYDIATNTVSTPASWQLPEACDESQAFIFSSSAVLAGCGQWPSALADTWIHGTSGNWTAGNPLNVARRNQAGFTVGTKNIPVVLGGYASDGFTALNSSEYDPNPLIPGALPARPRVVPARDATLY
jgi:hypothetical protein